MDLPDYLNSIIRLNDKMNGKKGPTFYEKKPEKEWWQENPDSYI